ncbi:MAG TPA: thiamine phosphate synthase, partial [Wenzhouxiangella sp.]|nr:thiamine phosphate synthase [Wenzhouxiangella sp.]
AITPDPEEVGGPDGVLDWTRGCLAHGVRLIRLRADSLDETGLIDLAGNFRRIAAEFGARWLLDGSPQLAEQLGADGVHIDEGELRKLSGRPLNDDFLVGAFCHSEAQLARAGELALDFVTLPVVPDQADAQPVDRDAFARLCRQSPLPVYALGGVAFEDLERTREHGGFGVAGTRGFTVQPRSFGERRRGSGDQA